MLFLKVFLHFTLDAPIEKIIFNFEKQKYLYCLFQRSFVFVFEMTASKVLTRIEVFKQLIVLVKIYIGAEYY